MFKFSLILLAVSYVQCIPHALALEDVKIDDDVRQSDEEPQKDIRTIINEGVKISDPIMLNRVVANLATLNYSLSNVNLTGLAKCIVKNAEINKQMLTLNIQWTCPMLYFDGQYQTKGTILVLPIEGRGDFNVRVGKFNMIANANLEKFKNEIGQDRLKIKKFNVSLIFLEAVRYELTNLFDGDKELAEQTLKFLNDNWKDVSEVIKEPVVNAWIKQALKNVNVFLKQEPVNKLIN